MHACVCVLISRKGLEFCVFDLSPLLTCLCLEYAPARLQRQPRLLACNVARLYVHCKVCGVRWNKVFSEVWSLVM